MLGGSRLSVKEIRIEKVTMKGKHFQNPDYFFGVWLRVCNYVKINFDQFTFSFILREQEHASNGQKNASIFKMDFTEQN